MFYIFLEVINSHIFIFYYAVSPHHPILSVYFHPPIHCQHVLISITIQRQDRWVLPLSDHPSAQMPNSVFV